MLTSFQEGLRIDVLNHCKRKFILVIDILSIRNMVKYSKTDILIKY